MVQLGHIAPVTEPVDSADGAATALILVAGSLRCALPLDEVIETMRPLAVRPLAGTPDFVLGISIMRGVPAPVVDLAALLAGERAEVSRFVAVRTDNGPVALAVGSVRGIGSAAAIEAGSTHGALLGGPAGRLVTGVGTLDGEPLLLLRSMGQLPDEVWAAAAAPS